VLRTRRPPAKFEVTRTVPILAFRSTLPREGRPSMYSVAGSLMHLPHLHPLEFPTRCSLLCATLASSTHTMSEDDHRA
jgi:hypothetical protein